MDVRSTQVFTRNYCTFFGLVAGAVFEEQPMLFEPNLWLAHGPVAGANSPWVEVVTLECQIWAWQACKVDNQSARLEFFMFGRGRCANLKVKTPTSELKKKTCSITNCPIGSRGNLARMSASKKPTFLNQNFSDVEPKYEINLAAAYLEPDVFSWSSYRFYWIKHPFWAKGKAAVQGRLC